MPDACAFRNCRHAGSQRLIAIAAEGERFDRALWTRTAAVTGGSGNSNALVGTPETVAQAILDYIDLGVDIISMRGYDLLTDAVDIGQQVIPIVREEVASATRQPPDPSVNPCNGCLRQVDGFRWPPCRLTSRQRP